MGDILKPSGTVRFISGSVYARVCVDPGMVDRRGLVSSRVLFCRACVCFGNGGNARARIKSYWQCAISYDRSHASLCVSI